MFYQLIKSEQWKIGQCLKEIKKRDFEIPSYQEG